MCGCEVVAKAVTNEPDTVTIDGEKAGPNELEYGFCSGTTLP